MRTEVIGGATLHLGDCRDIIPTLSGVDAVVTDPPYGVNWIPRVTNREKIIGDDQPFDPKFLLDIGTEHILFGGNHYASRLPDAGRWLLWLKHDQSLFGMRSTSPFELAWTNLGGAAKAFRWIWDGSIRQGASSSVRRCHSAEKPVEVMEWCISFTKGDVILDPFMGSGTTGMACARLGRRFIGIEIHEPYFDIACHRIEQAYRQRDLFVDAPVPVDPEEQRIADLFAEPRD